MASVLLAQVRSFLRVHLAHLSDPALTRAGRAQPLHS